MKVFHSATPGLVMLSMLLSLGSAACSDSNTPATSPSDVEAEVSSSSDVGREDAAQLDATQLDAAQLDAAPLDATQLDAGPLDAGALDATQLDAAQLDASALDAGPLDATQLDAAPLDAGPLDATPLDATQLDATQLDATQLDAAQLDAGALDAGPLDAGPLDAGALDAGALDAGPLDAASDADSAEDAGPPQQCITVVAGSFQHQAIDSQSGAFEIVWDVTPFDDASTIIVALALSPPVDPVWEDLATLVSFNNNNEIQVRNAATYEADVVVPYAAGETYRLREVVDLADHSYSVFVTPPASQEIELASDYAFRTEQNTVTSLNTMTLKSMAGSLQACLLSLHAIKLPVTVMIAPSSITLAPEDTQQFSADVSNASDSSVTWTVDEANCGTITAAGLYAAPATSQICHVRATSVEDPNASAVATVSIEEAANAGECSSYALPVVVPPYDATNPDHFLIQSAADWSHINDPDKHVFYVDPNPDYGTVTITASGTASEPRYLALHNATDLHPAQLPVAEQANVSLVFDGVSNWYVDRLSSMGHSDGYSGYELVVQPVSHDIVINRMNFSDFKGAVIVLSGTSDTTFTHDITIQRCRMDRMTAAGIDSDKVAIILAGSAWDEYRRVEDVHIVDNEIRDCNDGIMLLRHAELPGGNPVNYPGTVIDCNQIYVDSEVYTDGQGNHDPNGLWAWTENAIDLKAGSDDPSKPVIVSNNYMWGYRRTDKNGGGSGSWGTAFGGHYDVKNIEIHDNVVFDSNRGLDFGDPHGLPYSVENLYAHHNIFYNIGFHTEGGTEYCHYFYASKDVVYENNTVVGVDKHSRWFALSGDEEGLTVSCNAVIDSWAMTGNRAPSTVVEDNYFYNTEPQQAGDGAEYPSAADAHMGDLTFTADRYTNQPHEITLPGVVTTPSSPHAGWCAP